MKTKKGISPVITTILLIAFAFLLFLLINHWIKESTQKEIPKEIIECNRPYNSIDNENNRFVHHYSDDYNNIGIDVYNKGNYYILTYKNYNKTFDFGYQMTFDLRDNTASLEIYNYKKLDKCRENETYMKTYEGCDYYNIQYFNLTPITKKEYWEEN